MRILAVFEHKSFDNRLKIVVLGSPHCGRLEKSLFLYSTAGWETFNQVKSITNFRQQLFDAAISDFNPSECTCPICHAVGRIDPLRSSYTRTMISVSDGKRVDCDISIPRYRCESCGHTHGLLTDNLLLNSSFTPRFILAVLCEYLNRSCPVAKFYVHWGIAISTLYDWIHRFIDHHNA